MALIAVANPKGGVGKSTLATNIAGYYASRGLDVALGDIDGQQSARWWLQQRPAAARPITLWEASPDWLGRPPREAQSAVLDTPAGLQGWRLNDVLRKADRVVVPLQASVFDIFATRQFLDELHEMHAGQPERIGIVCMRVDPRTHAADQLQEFVATLGLPVLGQLRNTQNYVHLAAHGLTLFDVAPGRVARDLEQWRPLCRWLDAV
ncbi:ParA family protein [Comamonas sp. NLF-1-9]|uniref:ParA family protein n=1 Tax=Comamonas sp. NLF-1-9 TaxID=2853163 RepID=UPI001C46B45F|nr:ParA family protein [Comamonas sp. NLF-1-9]QXL84731.1 ParA family protein [Comamonas sp. NLF-1-9]